MGEKMASNQILEAWQGMWLSSFILGILAILLMSRANSDRPVLNKEWYFRTWNRIKKVVGK